MLIPYSFTATVNRTTTDRYGDVSTTGTHQVPGCVIAPRSSSEQVDRRDTVIVGLELYAPATADIRPTDTITMPTDPMVPVAYQGTTWQVTGEPGVFQSPFTGWAPGMQVALQRVTG